MRRSFILLLALMLLASCEPQATLQSGETRLYVALNGDVIVDAPRPISYADVRIKADVVTSTYLASSKPSEYGFYRLTFPEEPNANYPACLRIQTKGALAGGVWLTMRGDNYSEPAELDTRRRKAPEGC